MVLSYKTKYMYIYKIHLADSQYRFSHVSQNTSMKTQKPSLKLITHHQILGRIFTYFKADAAGLRKITGSLTTSHSMKCGSPPGIKEDRRHFSKAAPGLQEDGQEGVAPFSDVRASLGDSGPVLTRELIS